MATTNATSGLCCICLTEVGSTNCGSDHFTCADCLEQHVRVSCNLSDPAAQQMLLNKDGASIVACPFADIRGQRTVACKQQLRLSQLADALPSQVLDDVVAPAMVWVANSTGQAVAAEKMAKQGEQIKSRKKAVKFATQTMLRAALPNAYQCARCGHGPVLHSNCSNLSSHHRQLLPGGRHGSVRISNACEKCGWFASDITQWLAWDGRLGDEDNSNTQVGEEGSGFLSLLARSLWRNSWRIETLINYGIGVGISFTFSPVVLRFACWLVCTLLWFAVACTMATLHWSCRLVTSCTMSIAHVSWLVCAGVCSCLWQHISSCLMIIGVLALICCGAHLLCQVRQYKVTSSVRSCKKQLQKVLHCAAWSAKQERKPRQLSSVPTPGRRVQQPPRFEKPMMTANMRPRKMKIH